MAQLDNLEYLGCTPMGLKIYKSLSVDCPYSVEVAQKAWEELPDFKHRSKDEFISDYLKVTDEYSTKILAMNTDGIPVAGCTIEQDYDPHIGLCLTVQFNYCLEEYRHMGWHKWSMQYLRELAIKENTSICYAQRKRANQYLVRYVHFNDLKG